MAILYPVGYGTKEVTLEELIRMHIAGMEPEFARRLFNWIESKQGLIGIGSGIRYTQPVGDGFAPQGKSFHLRQKFADGSFYYSAVDLNTRTATLHSSGAIRQSDVPLQGTSEAMKWGVHINVGTPGFKGFEVWHMQCVEMDGYDSWVNKGRKRPTKDYPIPGTEVTPPLVVIPPVIPEPDGAPTPVPAYTIPEGEEMITGLWKGPNDPGIYAVCSNRTKIWCYPDTVDEHQALLRIEGKDDTVRTQNSAQMFRAFGPVVGPKPDGTDEYGWK